MKKIYEYLDYRQYLRDYYNYKKEHSKKFTFRYFSEKAGCGSPSYLKMIFDGKRNLSLRSIAGFNRALEHGVREGRYFEALIHLNQAKNESEQREYLERLQSIRPKIEMTTLQKAQQEFLSSTHYAVIREMVLLPDFVEDARWIANRLRNTVTPIQVEEAIKVLLTLKLLKRGKGGALVQVDASVGTPPEVVDLDVGKFHRQALSLAWASYMRDGQGFRDLKSITIPVAARHIPDIKELITQTMQSIIDKINEEPQLYDEIYQLNMQFFPMTKKIDE